MTGFPLLGSTCFSREGSQADAHLGVWLSGGWDPKKHCCLIGKYRENGDKLWDFEVPYFWTNPSINQSAIADAGAPIKNLLPTQKPSSSPPSWLGRQTSSPTTSFAGYQTFCLKHLKEDHLPMPGSNDMQGWFFGSWWRFTHTIHHAFPSCHSPLASFFTRGHRHDVHMAGHRHDVHMAGGVEHLSSAGTKGPRVMAGFGHENGKVNLEIVVY